MPEQTFFKKINIDSQPQFLQCKQNNEGDLNLQINDGKTMFAGKCKLISSNDYVLVFCFLFSLFIIIHIKND